MKAIVAVLFSVFTALTCMGNMAYMGPAPGQLSGVNIAASVRVQHELLTADLRNLPEGKARVFANYTLQSSQRSYIRFVFVASEIDSIMPEIILNGSLVNARSIHKSFNLSDSSEIGFGFQDYEQPLQDNIFEFEVWLDAGKNILKVGYECLPTSFFQGDLAYSVFPYFLGNQATKKQYDSVFLNVLLPEGVLYESSFEIERKTEAGFISKNLAKYAGTHLQVALYKDIQSKLDRSLLILRIAGFIVLLLTCVMVSIGYKKRLEKGKKIWLYFILYLIPGAVLITILYFSVLDGYYSYYREQYSEWLKGSWGRGYYLLFSPFFCVLVLALWTMFMLLYRVFRIKK